RLSLLKTEAPYLSSASGAPDPPYFTLCSINIPKLRFSMRATFRVCIFICSDAFEVERGESGGSFGIRGLQDMGSPSSQCPRRLPMPGKPLELSTRSLRAASRRLSGERKRHTGTTARYVWRSTFRMPATSFYGG